MTNIQEKRLIKEGYEYRGSIGSPSDAKKITKEYCKFQIGDTICKYTGKIMIDRIEKCGGD